MTILEAFQLKSGGVLTDQQASAVLQFEGLDPNATWDPDDMDVRCPFYKAVLDTLVSTDQSKGVKRISEAGGVTIEWDKAEISQGFYDLALESGCSSLIEKYNVDPIVQNKSYLW